ncbi:UNVERIFIED_CONTAM: X-X-X-Leu-X-X-Gly heptad repeat protein [Williamsia faeni]
MTPREAAQIAAWAQRVAAGAPALTDGQRDALRALFTRPRSRW